MFMRTVTKNWFWALLRQRCPRCGQGKVFRGSTRMNTSCPVCELPFERPGEEGYFVGAMYISYGLAVIILGLLLGVGYLLLPDWDTGNVALLAIAAFVPLVPMVFRYSRVIWIYFDRWAWPGSL
jgi:uncharacterized protein (DUF983 family)